jgi:2-iminobutanoate/2-iminopropanoate deaminase
MSGEYAIERHLATGAAFSDPAVVHGPGRWIEVSGQLGLDEDGAVPADFGREAELCFEHVRRSLARAGATFGDVVRIRAYLTNLEQYGIYAQARAEAFGDTPPASTAVGVSDLLLGGSLEIEVVAFLGDR